LSQTRTKVEEFEGCICRAVLHASKDLLVIGVSQNTLLDEPELAYTWPREDLPGLFALSL
jgi:hypothetical protein